MFWLFGNGRIWYMEFEIERCGYAADETIRLFIFRFHPLFRRAAHCHITAYMPTFLSSFTP